MLFGMRTQTCFPTVVSGVSVATVAGATIPEFREALRAGRSRVGRWKFFDDPRVLSRVGGDLSGWDVEGAMKSVLADVPADTRERAENVWGRIPWSQKISLYLALRACADARIWGVAPEEAGVIVGSTNVGINYDLATIREFDEDPDFLSPTYAIHSLDTDHSSLVSEVLGFRGCAFTVGAACASGNLALQAAQQQLWAEGLKCVVVVGPVLDFSPVYLHALGLVGAITTEKYGDTPERASRPFDRERDGFVPSHGGAAIVLEAAAHALERSPGSAGIWGELVAVATESDACHLPLPNEAGAARAIERVFRKSGVPKDQVGFISMHATSTSAGDLSEARAVRQVFGGLADRIPVNALKSIVGHSCGSAGIVETVAGLLQLREGWLHGTANLENLDPAIELNIPDRTTAIDASYFLKNSFGFGGINSAALFRRWT